MVVVVHIRISYDRIEEFNVHSKAKCGQLNLAKNVARNKKSITKN